MSEWDATIGFIIGLSYSIIPLYMIFSMGYSFKKKGYWESKKYIYRREKKNA